LIASHPAFAAKAYRKNSSAAASANRKPVFVSRKWSGEMIPPAARDELVHY
jgi:hypothetical protein